MGEDSDVQIFTRKNWTLAGENKSLSSIRKLTMVEAKISFLKTDINQKKKNRSMTQIFTVIVDRKRSMKVISI